MFIEPAMRALGPPAGRLVGGRVGGHAQEIVPADRGAASF